ncbi:MAG: peptidoglycan-binding protein, partial [Chloroflexi bacterium]|nr:peptidoglycan-binding protein [Chloroflexota bacterium]
AGTGGAKPHAKAARVHRATAHVARGNPLSGRGMWIWIVSDSNGGSVSSIISTARRYGVSTLFVKAGDGTNSWSQFNPQLVSALHANGLRACAWQYVYGNSPVAEAQVGAQAVRNGADCLMIDAEGEYEGKYISAQTYMTTLRGLVGGGYPLALAGLPYIDYHPAFPYSVFLGPGAAQYNAPQMYWYAIGTSVDSVYTHTYVYNRLYQRQIAPLGQVWEHPPPAQIVRFRQESRSYSAPGVSWWDWQEAAPSGWRAVAQPAGTLSHFSATSALAVAGRGAKGDVVVWAQEHLLKAGYSIPVDGDFGPSTTTATAAFQLAHHLSVDGIVGPQTWSVLLRYPPAAVTWTNAGARLARAAGRVLVRPLPKSASLPARRDEIPNSIGAGGAPR